jgi:hypothetical protein
MLQQVLNFAFMAGSPSKETVLQTGLAKVRKTYMSQTTKDHTTHVSEQALSSAHTAHQEPQKKILSPFEVQTAVQRPHETYDFCAEYTDKTKGPFYLECLQGEFLKAGGKQSDKNYPTEATLGTWNGAFTTWEGVKAYISHLKMLWKQEKKELEWRLPIPGYETVWFVKDLLLGRRIENDNVLILDKPQKDLTIFAFFRIGRQAKELQWKPAGTDTTKILPFSKSDLTMTQEPDAPFLSFQIQTILEQDRVKGVYFGDKRLHELIEFTLAQTSANMSYDSNENLGIPGLLGSLSLRSNCWLSTQQPIGVAAWRTISCFIRINELPHVVGDSLYILQYGPLSVRVRRDINLGSATSCSLWFQYRQDSWKGMGVHEKDAIYFYIAQDTDEETGEQHLRLFNSKVSDLLINPNEHLKSEKRHIFEVQKGKRLFPESNGYRISLGDTVRAKTLPMHVGWIRIFDYDLETNDVFRDVRNTWVK